MLIGSFTHGVDAKGRVFIPAKWRDDLGASVIVTRGIFGQAGMQCLFGMSTDAWKEFAARFSSLPETDVTGQTFRRMLFSNAAECELDKQGRILIPLSLREFAGMGAEAVLVGVDNRIEIWSMEKWRKHNDSMAADYNAALQQLAQRGI
ncbi:MAG: division/cell wall cluster transcriptional repressor MraZ [Clostridiales bacterium]|jgi:MraZ protein|nr:division/cell wall cluster transcriptional repressor MraZ [Clostridiales bacterium]